MSNLLDQKRIQLSELMSDLDTALDNGMDAYAEQLNYEVETLCAEIDELEETADNFWSEV